MRFLVLVKGTQGSEASVPEESIIATMASYHAELSKAGTPRDASHPQPSSKARPINWSRRYRSFIDGPFAETKELSSSS